MNWASFSLAPCTVHLAPLAVALVALPVCAQTPSQLELGVLEQTNLARTNPTALADHLEQMLDWFRGDVMYRPSEPVGIRTTEGPAAVREAITFLRRQQPLPPLDWSHGCGRLRAAMHWIRVPPARRVTPGRMVPRWDSA